MPVQQRVWKWLNATFGSAIAMSMEERSCRAMEEMAELVQAAGLSEEKAVTIIEHVYRKPPGDLPKELGDVLVCVYALAAAGGISADLQFGLAIASCERNADRIREKHQNKPSVIRGK